MTPFYRARVPGTKDDAGAAPLETIGIADARRLAVARAGLLAPERTGLPRRAGSGEAGARAAAGEVIRRFGYLQLDTASVTGARTHGIVLHSRLDGFCPDLAEELLRPGEPLFEYWGHEACWLPIELYPIMEFRRRAFRTHPWWGDVVGRHRDLADELLRRVREEGPLRSMDKDARRVASGLWSSGELAVSERRGFLRVWDLPERTIPAKWRRDPLPEDAAIERLVLLALSGHGFATTTTILATWRLNRYRGTVEQTLARLAEEGRVVPCELAGDDGKQRPGWIRPADLELAATLCRSRPRPDRGVLLSPFDPLLWDRARVKLLFGFDQILEIYKPAPQRIYGYYCLPVLAGDRLVARVDLKADRKAGRLRVLSLRHEAPHPSAADRAAAKSALARYAGALGLTTE